MNDTAEYPESDMLIVKYPSYPFNPDVSGACEEVTFSGIIASSLPGEHTRADSSMGCFLT